MRFGGSQNSAPSNLNLSPGGKCLNLAVKCCEIMTCPHLCSEGMKIKAGRVQNRDTQKGKNSAKHLGSTMHKGFTQLPTQQARITKCDLHLAMRIEQKLTKTCQNKLESNQPSLAGQQHFQVPGYYSLLSGLHPWCTSPRPRDWNPKRTAVDNYPAQNSTSTKLQLTSNN